MALLGVFILGDLEILVKFELIGGHFLKFWWIFEEVAFAMSPWMAYTSPALHDVCRA